MSCRYCEEKENQPIVEAREEYMPRYKVYISPKTLRIVISSYCGKNVNSKTINYCPMCGRCLTTTHRTYKAPPSDSKSNIVYGVNPLHKDAVQPVFHIGDKIRFKSTGMIEKVGEISHGGRFINSVSVEDVEMVKEK